MPSPAGKQVSRARTLLVPEPPVQTAWPLPRVMAAQLGSTELFSTGEDKGAWGWDDQELSISTTAEQDRREAQMAVQG